MNQLANRIPNGVKKAVGSYFQNDFGFLLPRSELVCRSGRSIPDIQPVWLRARTRSWSPTFRIYPVSDCLFPQFRKESNSPIEKASQTRNHQFISPSGKAAH